MEESTSETGIFRQMYKSPERKDWKGDSRGGVLIYVKETPCHRRRYDPEFLGIECTVNPRYNDNICSQTCCHYTVNPRYTDTR